MTTIVETGTELLERLGNLPEDYRHRDRESTAAEAIELSNAILKWNSVHVAGVPIPADETAAARALVRELDRTGKLDVGHGLGLVVHHKSTAVAFVMVSFWHGNNEFWEAVFYRAVGGPIDEFKPNPNRGLTLPFACVWEMSPIWHERNAWSNFLKSDRSLAAKRIWLADVYTGIA